MIGSHESLVNGPVVVPALHQVLCDVRNVMAMTGITVL